MTNNGNIVTSEIAALQREVDQLAEIRSRVRAVLIAERAGETPSTAELEAAIKAAQQEVEEVNRKLEAVKASIRQHRAYIKAEQDRYERLPLAQRIPDLPKLEARIKARLAQIAELEQEIVQLHAEQWQATESVEFAKQHLAAVRAGYHRLPMEQDPRLATLEVEYQRKKAQLDQLTGS